MVGVSLSGLIVTIIRMIILAIFGPESANIKAILIYYGIAIILGLVDLILNLLFFSS